MAKGSDRMASRWIRVSGVEMHTRVSVNDAAAESSTPVVLVHGLGVSSSYWLPTASLLAESYRVFAPDFPGFGESEKPDHALDLRELSEILVALMDELEIERAVLVGNSMGCQIAVNAALAHPERITRMVLQGPTIDPNARSASRQVSRLLMDGFVEPPSILPVVTRDYLKCGYRRIAETLQYALDDSIEEKLPLIEIPAVVVRGAHDPIVPQQWAESAAQLLPLGRLVVVPRGSHALNFSRPRELAGIIREFLS